MIQAIKGDARLVGLHLHAGLAQRPLKSEQTLRQMVILHRQGKRNGSLTSNLSTLL